MGKCRSQGSDSHVYALPQTYLKGYVVYKHVGCVNFPLTACWGALGWCRTCPRRVVLFGWIARLQTYCQNERTGNVCLDVVIAAANAAILVHARAQLPPADLLQVSWLMYLYRYRCPRPQHTCSQWAAGLTIPFLTFSDRLAFFVP